MSITPITPTLDNATIFLACLGNGDNSNRWLNGNTTNGQVDVIYRLPSQGVNLSGCLWKAVPSPSLPGTYLLQSLGSIKNANYQYLTATSSESVGLTANSKDKTAMWELQVVANPADFYPHQPWGSVSQQSYTFRLSNVAWSTYIDGDTQSGKVSLTTNTNLSGTNWLVLVAAWG